MTSLQRVSLGRAGPGGCQEQYIPVNGVAGQLSKRECPR